MTQAIMCSSCISHSQTASYSYFPPHKEKSHSGQTRLLYTIIINEICDGNSVYVYDHEQGTLLTLYPTKAILQRHLQCNISDIRQYWVATC